MPRQRGGAGEPVGSPAVAPTAAFAFQLRLHIESNGGEQPGQQRARDQGDPWREQAAYGHRNRHQHAEGHASAKQFAALHVGRIRRLQYTLRHIRVERRGRSDRCGWHGRCLHVLWLRTLRHFNRCVRYYGRRPLVGDALQCRFDGRVDLCGLLSGIPSVLDWHHPRGLRCILRQHTGIPTIDRQHARAGAKRNGCGMRVDIHDRGAGIGRIGNNGIGYVSNNGCADCLRGLNELRQGARADGVFSRHMV